MLNIVGLWQIKLPYCKVVFALDVKISTNANKTVDDKCNPNSFLYDCQAVFWTTNYHVIDMRSDESSRIPMYLDGPVRSRTGEAGISKNMIQLHVELTSGLM